VVGVGGEEGIIMTAGHDPDRPVADSGGLDRPLEWRPPPVIPGPRGEPGPPAVEAVPYPPPAAPVRATSGSRAGFAWRAAIGLMLIASLVAALTYQGMRLSQVSDQLAETSQRLEDLSQGHLYVGERLDAVEERAGELERAAGEAFDPEAIAVAVIPSVFKVIAGDFTGTAFAVGRPADDGGTNLFTNHHVVEQVWLRGDREVFLERRDQRYSAEIVDVDRGKDVAWLHTSSSFVGLIATEQDIRTGQPIVSVGAPLGLGDTVTTGVVSNTSRDLPDGSGPWIQFDASVEPGNSGGPVINAAHEVVGIATRKATDFDGIGFAVPIADACALFDICHHP
jgi:putative serine protease PepD